MTGITVAQILFGLIKLSVINGDNIAIATIATGAFSLHFGIYPLTFVLIPEIIPEKVIENIPVLQIDAKNNTHDRKF